MLVTTKEPLSLVAIYQISKNKPIKLGDYKCRIMNFSANQKIEAVTVVEYMGHKWGIKPIAEPKSNYNALAFVVKE
jgi:hypothetical protein